VTGASGQSAEELRVQLARAGGRPRFLATRARTLWARPEFPLALFVVALGVAIQLANSRFGTSQNLLNVSRQATVLAILSVGQLFVIVVGGIDISIAAVMALSSVVGVLLAGHIDPSLALALAAGCGLAIGAVNGILISYLRLSAIVVTIAVLQALAGVSLLLSGSKPLYPDDIEGYRSLAASTVAGLPTMVLVAVAVLVLSHLLLTRTTFGRSVYAVGGNETAAFLAGISVQRVKFLCYVISGLLSGIAGVILSSRVTTGGPTLGAGLEFATFAAVFIGGARWGGGQGSVFGVALGAVLLTMIANALDLLVAPQPIQTMVTGLLIVLALGVYKLRRAG
jgi:ribose/xylose/arabinose/galactoside ABC-type transport system permease subunit